MAGNDRRATIGKLGQDRTAGGEGDLGFGVLTVPKGQGRRLLTELVSREDHAAFVESLVDDPDLATTLRRRLISFNIGDEPHPRLGSEVGVRPLEQHHDSIAKPDEVHDVDE